MRGFLSKYGWMSVAVLLLTGLVGLSSVSGVYTVSLNEKQIQDRVNGQLDRDFSVPGAAKSFLKTVRAQSAHVHVADGHIQFLIDLSGVLQNDAPFSATIAAVGAPRYQDGAFYFDPENIEAKNFSLAGASPGDLAERIGQALKLGDRAKKLFEKGEHLAQGWLMPFAENMARHILAKRPVYRLHDDVKGFVIKSSLQSVRVVGDSVEIVLDLWRVGAPAIFGFLCLSAATGLAIAVLAQRAAAARSSPPPV